ncbi:MAG: alanine racemase [Candidatus Berkelbacteria bacterium]
MQDKRAGIRTWIEIDKSALKHNYNVFRGLIAPNVKLMAIAKSNAYGHGLIEYAETMAALGTDWLGVDSITEALKLRSRGLKTPILILGHTLAERYQECSENNLTIALSSFDQIKNIKPVPYNIAVHIKIDTGMHRQGFQLEEVEKASQQIKKIQNIEVTGIFTHFAVAKNPAFPTDTNEQIRQFEEACNIAKKYFGKGLIKHAAATAGTLLFPKSHYDMVRIGIGLFGLWTSKEAEAYLLGKVELKPALTWKTIVAEVKKVKAGERISYDLTEKLSIDSKIAILPIGYWNGFRRSLSSIGHVLIRGQRAKVLGRVTMDMIIVDVTNIANVKSGDEVTLIGRDGDLQITADEIAILCETSNYEIVTQLNPLMRRIYD